MHYSGTQGEVVDALSKSDPGTAIKEAMKKGHQQVTLPMFARGSSSKLQKFANADPRSAYNYFVEEYDLDEGLRTGRLSRDILSTTLQDQQTWVSLLLDNMKKEDLEAIIKNPNAPSNLVDSSGRRL
jgi:hypothetical protein